MYVLWNRHISFERKYSRLNISVWAKTNARKQITSLQLILSLKTIFKYTFGEIISSSLWTCHTEMSSLKHFRRYYAVWATVLSTLWKSVVIASTTCLNIQQVSILSTERIYVFCIIPRTNYDYFHNQHLPVDLCNGEVLCSLCGTDSILKYYSVEWSPTHKLQRLSTKAIQSLWVQVPDIHPIKVLSEKDKLPDGFMFPPVTIAPSLNMSRPSVKTTNSLA
jgi:hypothetical protein